MRSFRGPQVNSGNRRNDFRFPDSSETSQNSFIPPTLSSHSGAWLELMRVNIWAYLRNSEP